MAGRAEEIIKRGRRLSAFSFAILVYIWTGASVDEHGIFFGGGISFSEPNKLEAVALVVFLFFCYRFYLVANDKKSHFIMLLVDSVKKEKAFKEFVERKAIKEIEAKDGSDGVIGPIKLHEQLDRERPFAAEWKPSDGLQVVGWQFELNARVIGKVRGAIDSFPLRFPIYHAPIVVTKAGFIAIFFADSFWEQYLPAYLALIATIVVQFRVF